jgi:hypothetical protein
LNANVPEQSFDRREAAAAELVGRAVRRRGNALGAALERDRRGVKPQNTWPTLLLTTWLHRRSKPPPLIDGAPVDAMLGTHPSELVLPVQ